MRFLIVFLGFLTLVCARSRILRLFKSNKPQPPDLPEFRKYNTPRITGGLEAVPHSLPFQVGLHIRTTRFNINLFCGGMLITKRHILTAGHCAANVFSIIAIFGAHDIFDSDEPGRMNVTIAPHNIIVHKDYSATKMLNDIAILKLEEKMKLSSSIQTIALPKSEDANFENVIAITSGWGYVSDDQRRIAAKLQYVEVQVISLAKCKKSYPRYIVEKQMCTSGLGGVSTCNGDSGGPLYFMANKKKPILIGITSFGATRCSDGHPSVYTAVNSYLDWIKNNTKSKAFEDGNSNN